MKRTMSAWLAAAICAAAFVAAGDAVVVSGAVETILSPGGHPILPPVD